MSKVLITGGAGFIGSNLIKYLLDTTSVNIVSFDRIKVNTKTSNARVNYVVGDLCSRDDIENVFKTHGPFMTVYHLGAIMPDKSAPDSVLWKTNVFGTKILADIALAHGTHSFVFASSNVTYGIPSELPVTETTPTNPIEIYGRSKVEAEKILKTFVGKMNVKIFRCPVVTGIGRLGLQAILFEFISEGKNVYVLGNGSNRYQFADVEDVCDALEKASHIDGFDIYNIGSDEVLSLREIYQRIIHHAHSKSRIISIPSGPALFALAVLNKLKLSPLGVYQYTMIGRSLFADMKKIKEKLSWKPKKTNVSSFIENYGWYRDNIGKFAIVGSINSSSNRSVPKMGILKLLKLLS